MGACACPKATALTPIPTQDCKVNLEQIQKFLFQRPGYIFDGTADPTPVDITKKADWLTLKAATDNTKVIASPLIGGDPVIAPGEAITTGGGDNSTLNGVEELTGVNPSTFTGVYKGLASAVKKAMKKLNCEDLVVYMVNQNDQIVANLVAEDQYAGIPISNFFIGDRGNNGFGTTDTHAVSFKLPAGWDDDIVLITPEAGFSPLRDL